MSKSKKVTVGYQYLAGVQFILGHGPMDALLSIVCDNKYAWTGLEGDTTITVDKQNLFGGDTREGGLFLTVDIELGKSTQTKNTYLQSHLGTDIPAFRGVTTLVFNQSYFGMNPYLKSFAFKAQRVYTGWDGNTQWYSAKAGIEYDFAGSVGWTDSALWKYKVEAVGTNNDYSSPTYDDSSWSTGYLPIGDVYNATAAASGLRGTPKTVVALQKETWLRRSFYLPVVPPSVPFYAWVDNDCEVWVNGTKVITDTGNIFGHLLDTTIAGSYFNEGSNIVAIKVTDDVAQSGVDKYFFDLQWLGHQVDMNPVHIIRECLTSTIWGLGRPTSEIDDTNFQAVADTLYNEELGISIIWDRQVKIQEFILEILRHIDATLYIDRTTGLFTLKLIRDDYTVGSLTILDNSNIDKVENYTRPEFNDLTNHVTVNYWDVSTEDTGSVSADNTSALDQFGIVPTVLQYPGITHKRNASRVAQRDIITLSAPLLSATIIANREASSLNIGDVFKFVYPEKHNGYIVMRITQMSFGDGKTNKIKIECVEDVFYLPSNSIVKEEPDGWVDPSQNPDPPTDKLVQEVPYWELVQTLGESDTDDILSNNSLAGYLSATAAKPTTGGINMRLAVDAGGGYEDDSVTDFCPVADLAANITRNTTSVAISNAVDIASVEPGSLAQINNEIIKVTTVTSSLLTFERGVLDTVPENHSLGDTVFFWDGFAASDGVEYDDAENLNIKLLTVTGQGVLDIADAVADAVTMDQRAYRPYPPGNVKLNSSYFPDTILGTVDIALSWAHRDRTQQTSPDPEVFTDGNIGPETNVSYTIRIYGEDDSLGRTVTGETGTTYNYPQSTEETDFTIPGSGGGDPSFSNVQLLLHCDGADEGTTFTDSSSAARTVSTSGNVNTEQDNPKFGTAAAQFDGSGDRLNVTIPALGTQDFTLEWWCYPVNGGGGANYGRMFQIGPNATNGGLWVVRNATNNPMLVLSQLYSGSYQNIFSPGVSSSVSNTTWHHLALVRESGKWSLYIDGVRDQYQSSTPSGNNITATTLYIGANHTAGEAWNGQMDDIRLTIGKARYSGSTLTIPTTPFPDYAASAYRVNGRLRFEIESSRTPEPMISRYKHNFEVFRTGFGFNFGSYFGGQ